MRAFVLALALLVPAVTPAPAAAQWYPSSPWSVSSFVPTGIYLNTANGGTCTVTPHVLGYEFRNENGDWAIFRFVTPNRLAIVSTINWDRTVVATIGWDALGRFGVRFDSAFSAPGYWLFVR